VGVLVLVAQEGALAGSAGGFDEHLVVVAHERVILIEDETDVGADPPGQILDQDGEICGSGGPVGAVPSGGVINGHLDPGAYQCGPRCSPMRATMPGRLRGCSSTMRSRRLPGWTRLRITLRTATGSGTAAAAMTYSARLVSSTKDRLRHLPNRALRMTAQCSMVGCGTVMARIPVAAHRPGDTSSRRAHTPGAPLRRIPGPRARPARRDARPRPHLGRRCGAGKNPACASVPHPQKAGSPGGRAGTRFP